MPKRQDLKTLRNLISEADKLLSTTELPDARSQRAHELLQTAVALADTLMEIPPAAILGAKGGSVTAKRGSEYFRQIAAKRKTRAGGRPRQGVYCSSSRNDFGPVGESIEIAPNLRIIKTGLAVSDIAGKCRKLADAMTPVFVCRLILDGSGFSGYTPTIDEDAKIRAFLGLSI